MAVRFLAKCWLYEELRSRVPDDARKIPYNPGWPAKQRQDAVRAWKKALPPGKRLGLAR
jgi:hypothetical protein